MHQDLTITTIEKPSTARVQIQETLASWSDILPASRSARILLKPNFNSNFNALTGNTTDLRLLAGVIEFLQHRGYSNITIGEGTNSGFVREGISVIHRLRADQLAAQYGINIVDLNACTETVKVPLQGGGSVEVASVLQTSDFVINMPKLKTHYEVGMSVCLKNLMGTCRGRENKKKIHQDLGYNIVRLNMAIKPHLHIVDGLIAMEGNGPSRGMPVNFGKIIVGTNPYQVDYICARLAGFPPDQVKPLAVAVRMGIISAVNRETWDQIPLGPVRRSLERPLVSPLVRFVINPRFQKHLIRIRYAPGIRTICSSNLIKDLFYRLGISQERIRSADANLTFTTESVECGTCAKCSEYCPTHLPLETIKAGGGERCIDCLYCVSVCPKDAFVLKGEAGFYSDQIRIYGNLIREIT